MALESSALKVEVADIEGGYFFTSKPKPGQRLDDSSISECWGSDNDFFKSASSSGYADDCICCLITIAH